MTPAPRAVTLAFAILFVVAGLLHFLFPAAYTEIVPPGLPAPRVLVYASGAMEILGGLGLLASRTQQAARSLLIVLLLLVWPANFQMLTAARAAHEPLGSQLLLWLRLPIQLLLAGGLWYGTGQRASPRRAPPG